MEQYHLSTILEGGSGRSRQGAYERNTTYEHDTMFVPTMDSIGGHDLAEFDSSTVQPITVIGGSKRSTASSNHHNSQSITSSSGEFSASTVHKSLIDLFDGLRSRRVGKTREHSGHPVLKRKDGSRKSASEKAKVSPKDNLDILNILADEKTNSSDSETDTDYDSYGE